AKASPLAIRRAAELDGWRPRLRYRGWVGACRGGAAAQERRRLAGASELLEEVPGLPGDPVLVAPGIAGDVGVPATEGADPRRVLRVAVLEVVAEVGPVLPNRDVVRDGAAVVRRLLDGDEFRAALLLLVVHPGEIGRASCRERGSGGTAV